jgi:hypothetical protein
MSPEHHPDPEFVSNLEWQIRTALRREQRFTEPVQSRSGGRMKIATLVLMSALFGAGGVAVKDEIQESRKQELLLVEVEANQRLEVMQIELLRARVEEVRRQFEVGLIHEESLQEAELLLREAEIRLTSLHLDEEEIRISGQEPGNRVSSPLVDGRDFVSERLNLQAAAASERLSRAQARLSRLRELHAMGAVGDEALADGNMALGEPETRLQEITRMRSLREEFLSGAITGEAAERELELTRTRGELDLQLQAMDRATALIQYLETRVQMGAVSESELRAARLQFMQAETRVELLRLKLEVLEEGGWEG